MDVKDRFTLMYESLKDEFKGYVDNLVRTWAATLIAIGWILTSEQSRDFLAKQRAAYWWLLAAIVVIGILHLGVCESYYRRSQKRINFLIGEFTDIDSPYINKEYYLCYKITRPIFGTGLLVSLFLLTVLFMMVFSLH